MAASLLRDEEGKVIGIACGRGQQPIVKCRHCESQADYLCDFLITSARGKKRTCNAPICGECREIIGPDRDHCKGHQGLIQESLIPTEGSGNGGLDARG